MELQKKNRVPLTYSNDSVFIQAFKFKNEMYVSVDNKGFDFVSLNSDKKMNIYDLEENSSDINVISVPNINDLTKKYFIGKIIKSGDKEVKITRIFIKIENNKILLKMNNTNV